MTYLTQELDTLMQERFPLEEEETLFLLFSWYRDKEGGAHDFRRASYDLHDLMKQGEDLYLDVGARLSTSFHIAALSLSTLQMEILLYAAVPGTQHYDFYNPPEFEAEDEPAFKWVKHPDNRDQANIRRMA